MTSIFLTVTDLELTAAQFVKFILLAILLFGGVFNIFEAIKGDSNKKKLIRTGIAFILFLLAIPIVLRIQVEASLLSSPKYAVGTTVGFCQVFAKGKGIEFEYQIAGKKYKNCNTFHPIPKDSIIVPNGKYYVRFSEKYPGKGRINFNKPVEQ